MKQTIKGTLFILELNELDSTFIKTIVYDAKSEVLSVVLQNDNTYNYDKVPLEIFLDFQASNSFGSYYNSNIKNKFKHLNLTKMAESNGNKPNKINKAGDFKRYIKLQIDVTKLKKDWFYVSKDEQTGEVKAIYAKLTLAMLPDGTVDKYGQLGFIVQDVPADIAKENKDNKDIKGPILGNGEELEWNKREEKIERVNTSVGSDEEDELDKLPF
jgi:hypothetical protein